MKKVLIEAEVPDDFPVDAAADVSPLVVTYHQHGQWTPAKWRILPQPTESQGAASDRLRTNFQRLSSFAERVAEYPRKQEDEMSLSSARDEARILLEIIGPIENNLAPHQPHAKATSAETQVLSDGFGNHWAKCGPACEMEIVRPGKVQCDKCDNQEPATQAVVPDDVLLEAAQLISRNADSMRECSTVHGVWDDDDGKAEYEYESAVAAKLLSLRAATAPEAKAATPEQAEGRE